MDFFLVRVLQCVQDVWIKIVVGPLLRRLHEIVDGNGVRLAESRQCAREQKNGAKFFHGGRIAEPGKWRHSFCGSTSKVETPSRRGAPWRDRRPRSADGTRLDENFWPGSLRR